MTLRTEILDEIFVVTITRPDVRNCVDRQAVDAHAEAFRRVEADDSLHVAILQEDSGCFCAGSDWKEASSGGANAVLSEGDGPMGPARMLPPKPVIGGRGVSGDEAVST